MEKTKAKRKHARWTHYGDFSVHFGSGVANINSRVKRPFIHVESKESDSWLNSYQYFLFRRALYGLEVYTQEEIRYLSTGKKKRIQSVHNHAKQVINLFKQRLLTEYTNRMLKKLFFSSKDVNLFISTCSELDPDFQCEIKLEQLGVDRKAIARELVEKKCLPYNFFELTVNDDPRMAKLRAPQEPIDRL